MKRILHVLYSTNVGGVESWLMSLYQVLDISKVQFDFLVYSDEPGHFDALIQERGGRIFYAGAGLGRYWRHWNKIKEVILSTEYAAIHCHNVEGGALPLFFAKVGGSARLVIQSHNDFEAKMERATGLRKYFIKFEKSVVLRMKPKAVAVSQRAGDTLFGSGNYEIIPLGIDLHRFEIQHDPSVKVKHGFNAREHIIIGHVGRFTIEKNHDFFINVATELIRMDERYRFVFVGEGKLQRDIEGKVADLGVSKYFTFLGLRDDVPSLMLNLFDAFLFPSISEGLGLAVIESQIAGLPTVCSENVPHEARFNAELCVSENLDESAVVWAERCHTFFLSRINSLRKVSGVNPHREFDIKGNVERLLKLWGCA